ncbi:MAG: invasion associated locus B family protein [Tabrizicola sp.]|jgi:invasion protein IalB|nr:invasion associated locus B family protein [Tabrizicola sp.]
MKFPAALAVMLLTGPALAQDEAGRVMNGQTFGAWTVSCEAIAAGETVCVLNQQLVRDTDQAFLAQFLALWSDDGTKRYILARVPVGVYLPFGMALQPEVPDGEATLRQMIWQSCNGQVCEALVEFGPEEIASFVGPDIAILASYQPSLGKDPVVFRFSMDGLVDGMDALHPDK